MTVSNIGANGTETMVRRLAEQAGRTQAAVEKLGKETEKYCRTAEQITKEVRSLKQRLMENTSKKFQ